MALSRRSSSRIAAVAAGAALLVGVFAASPAEARPPRPCTPGAPGVGDAYFPGYGNGGYDVRNYDLDISYDPATDRLDGRASITARATQDLCSLNLDLVGLEVRDIEVGHRQATWTRSGQELTVTPSRPLRAGQRFEVDVTYDGVPVEFVLPGFGIRTGFMTTPDGVTVAGQPEVAAAWFPVNDHPIDKASYSFDVRVPNAYEVVANGVLRNRHERRGWTSWK
jgi:aminopeptidase N